MQAVVILAALSVAVRPTGEKMPLTEAPNIIGLKRAKRRKSILMPLEVNKIVYRNQAVIKTKMMIVEQKLMVQRFVISSWSPVW
jgi:hypothetical protein